MFGPSIKKWMRDKSLRIWLSLVVAAIITTTIVVIVFKDSQESVKISKRFQSIALHSDKPLLGIYKQAAISTMGIECARIGTDMLKRNGSAIDAAIATLICEGIASPASMGLGGGFLMTIYDATSGNATFLDARESAPALSDESMFVKNPSLAFQVSGGLSVAVPGELKGYWQAHRRYGRLPWKDLFEPSIELCKVGAQVNQYLYDSMRSEEAYVKSEKTLREIFVNPSTNEIYNIGDYIKRPILAQTLQQIADHEDPVELFYRGSMTENLVAEIKAHGGIVSVEDFSEYEVKWREPIKISLGNLTIHTAPPPGSGALLGFVTNIMAGYEKTKNETLLWGRIIEAYKWAYAKRTQIGDPDFIDVDDVLKNLTSKDYANEIRSLINDDKTYNGPSHYGAEFSDGIDRGTLHTSVLAPDGSAVSVTTTINDLFGARFRSSSTGIIFNDEMDDFSSPNFSNGFDLSPSPRNYIKPFKRPLSSMTPTIVVDKNGKVRLIVGGAGGSKITTSVVLTLILNLIYDYNIKEAADSTRLHHQLMPMSVVAEASCSPEILNALRKIGHNITIVEKLHSAVTAIEQRGKDILAYTDPRRQGSTDGF